MNHALIELYEKQGQSPWWDFIRRDMMQNGGLARYVESVGIRAVTANPTIFDKAIAGEGYDPQIADLEREGLPPRDLFERRAITDVKARLRHPATGVPRIERGRRLRLAGGCAR